MAGSLLVSVGLLTSATLTRDIVLILRLSSFTVDLPAVGKWLHTKREITCCQQNVDINKKKLQIELLNSSNLAKKSAKRDMLSKTVMLTYTSAIMLGPYHVEGVYDEKIVLKYCTEIFLIIVR